MSGITVTDLGVAYTTAAGATCVYTLTAGQNIPSGALIVVIVDEYVNAGGSVSGTGSCKDTVNTGGYTAITAIANDGSAADGRGQIFYQLNASAVPHGDAITYTKTATGNDTAMSCFYVTGIATTNALDTSVTATTTGNMPTAAGSAAFSFTSGTPAVAGELFVAGVSAYDTSASSWISTLDPASAGWATPFDWSGVPTNGKATVAGASLVNAGTGTVTFAPTVVLSGVSRHFAAWILGFKPLVTTDISTITTSLGSMAQVLDAAESIPTATTTHLGHFAQVIDVEPQANAVVTTHLGQFAQVLDAAESIPTATTTHLGHFAQAAWVKVSKLGSKYYSSYPPFFRDPRVRDVYGHGPPE